MSDELVNAEKAVTSIQVLKDAVEEKFEVVKEALKGYRMELQLWMLNSAPDNKLRCLIKKVEVTEELTGEVVWCTLALAKRKDPI